MPVILVIKQIKTQKLDVIYTRGQHGRFIVNAGQLELFWTCWFTESNCVDKVNYG